MAVLWGYKLFFMKKTEMLTVLFLTLLLSACSPAIYKAQNFDNSKKDVKVVAILPYIISVGTKRLPKGVTKKTLKEYQEQTGRNFQIYSFNAFMKQKEDYAVVFQDIDTTNTLLNSHNINFDNIALQGKPELCKMLGVDGIISGGAIVYRPGSFLAGLAGTVGVNVIFGLMTGGLAVANGAFGVANVDVPGVFIPGGRSSRKLTSIISFYNASGTLLWKQIFQNSGYAGCNEQCRTIGLMENVSMEFPLKK